MSKMRLDVGQRKLHEVLHFIRETRGNLAQEQDLLRQDMKVIDERAHPSLQEYGHIAHLQEKSKSFHTSSGIL